MKRFFYTVHTQITVRLADQIPAKPGFFGSKAPNPSSGERMSEPVTRFGLAPQSLIVLFKLPAPVLLKAPFKLVRDQSTG